jgi:CTP synthase (UTP-ammonia lyase)
MTVLDPRVWGPHYWHFLHTIALTYPNNPNAITKKKYYEFINTLPLFLPIEKMGSEFSKLLNLYPVQPYLDNRESFVKWVWFIHNKINEKLEKPKISLQDFYINYYEQYKSVDEKLKYSLKMKQKIVYISLIISVTGLIYYLYEK